MQNTDRLVEHAQRLRSLLHAPAILVLANAWDPPSARLVARAGLPAVATSSAGIAWSLGYPDGQRIGRAEMLAAVARIVRAVDVPVTADLEAGYGDAPAEVARTIEGALEAGAVGVNIEDSTGRGEPFLYSRDDAVRRIEAAREAAQTRGVPLLINARTDAFFPGGSGVADPLVESVRRGRAYLEAGADCVFVPWAKDRDTIDALVRGIGGPVNILALPGVPALPELEALGVARVSIGSAFSRMAYGRVQQALGELMGAGTYGFMEGDLSHGEINALLGA